MTRVTRDSPDTGPVWLRLDPGFFVPPARALQRVGPRWKTRPRKIAWPTPAGLGVGLCTSVVALSAPVTSNPYISFECNGKTTCAIRHDAPESVEGPVIARHNEGQNAGASSAPDGVHCSDCSSWSIRMHRQWSTHTEPSRSVDGPGTQNCCDPVHMEKDGADRVCGQVVVLGAPWRQLTVQTITSTYA